MLISNKLERRTRISKNSSKNSPEFSEKSYLAELIRDFPAEDAIDVGLAWTRIEAHFRAIEQSQDALNEFVSSQTEPFDRVFYNLARALHGFLFRGILSNAGEFRRGTDPRGGLVAFGTDVSRNPWGSKFMGTAPKDIEEQIRAACSLLMKIDLHPIASAILFYQKFVRIHPFYDANGRVVRLLITLYLRYHGHFVLWKELEENKKNEFLRKLNNCHLREGQQGFQTYFDYLFNFWQRFVKPIPPEEQI
jgi:Fic family protein